MPMKSTTRLQVILGVLLFAAVTPAWSQTTSEVKTNLPPLEQMLQHLPGYHPHANQNAGQTGGAKQEIAHPASAKVYAFATADYPGAASSVAFDTNNTTIVGFLQFNPNGTATTPPSPETAFIVKSGVYELLDIPGATSSGANAATGINTSGQIVGFYTDSSMVPHGFLDTAGTFTDVDYPGANGTDVFDINDSGEMVGAFTDTTGIVHGYLDNGGTFTQIDYPGASTTIAVGINSSGEIVGIWEDSMNNTYGFTLKGGVFTLLIFPLGNNTEPIGVNTQGEISGYYQDAAGVVHGFIYSNGAFSEVDVAGSSGTELTRIKNYGAITGAFVDALLETHGVKGH
jgi:probable HAF family extracellular repeat protein